MSQPRSARTVANPDGTQTLRIHCQGVNLNHLGEEIPCEYEQRYVLTAEKLAAYIQGAPLTDIWDDPDEDIADPWCPEHRSVER